MKSEVVYFFKLLGAIAAWIGRPLVVLYSMCSGCWYYMKHALPRTQFRRKDLGSHCTTYLTIRWLGMSRTFTREVIRQGGGL